MSGILLDRVPSQSTPTPPHSAPARPSKLFGRLNRLRATVLGANDGIVSEAGLMIGVAGATSARTPLVVVGLTGLAAGAVSMALGEYVSVSSQRDAEHHHLAMERRSLVEDPAGELVELTGLYEAKGLSPATARRVAEELTAADALAAHAEAELRIDPDDMANPWHAAIASALSFIGGALVPLIAITVPPPRFRVTVAVGVVLAALACAGWLGARVGGGRRGRAMLRVLLGGAIGLAVTYGVGHLAGNALAEHPERAAPVSSAGHEHTSYRVVGATKPVEVGKPPASPPTPALPIRVTRPRSAHRVRAATATSVVRRTTVLRSALVTGGGPDPVPATNLVPAAAPTQPASPPAVP